MSYNINELDLATDFRKVAVEETIVRRPIEKNNGLVSSKSPSYATTPNEWPSKNVSGYRNYNNGVHILAVEENETQKKATKFNPEYELEFEQEESSKEMVAVAWRDEVDRFSNFVTKKNMTHLELHSIVEEILKNIQSKQQSLDDNNNNGNNSNNNTDKKSDGDNITFSSLSSLSLSSPPMSKDIFTYTPYKNWFLCKISSKNEEEERMSEFSIGIYTYQEGKCLLDVQELSGEHFTFTHFFENLKTILREQDVIDAPAIKKEILSAYGLDMDIGLEIFN